MHKTTFLLLSTILVAGTAFAGGSILGHKKKSNPYGVNAINVHICDELECPPVRIVEGDCSGEHMEMRYGVCLCEAGYVGSGSTCALCPSGQVSDGITGCRACASATYKATESATACTACSDTYATACADITGASTACIAGYMAKEGTCIIAPYCATEGNCVFYSGSYTYEQAVQKCSENGKTLVMAADLGCELDAEYGRCPNLPEDFKLYYGARLGDPGNDGNYHLFLKYGDAVDVYGGKFDSDTTHGGVLCK